ncbi:MAG TPA: metallophosphoesterase family protein [Dehalococcoidia bacterium]|nr:metallophosphoesterase family protein [Dehalococcoidia bacterium]
MRIGLISDTHIPSMGPTPPPQVARAFQGVDLILHAGDVYIPSCLEWLARIAPVEATMSGKQHAGEGAGRFSQVRVVEAEAHSIGLTHELTLWGLGDDVLPGIIQRKFPPEQSLPIALQEVFGKAVDIVVFGYTHEAMVETHQGVLLVNPGSPTVVKQVRRLGTVAILELTPERREARIIDLAGLDE